MPPGRDAGAPTAWYHGWSHARQHANLARGERVVVRDDNRRIRHVPVVEHDGRLCGIVSIGDVVNHRLDDIQREAESMREYISCSR